MPSETKINQLIAEIKDLKLKVIHAVSSSGVGSVVVIDAANLGNYLNPKEFIQRFNEISYNVVANDNGTGKELKEDDFKVIDLRIDSVAVIAYIEQIRQKETELYELYQTLINDKTGEE